MPLVPDDIAAGVGLITGGFGKLQLSKERRGTLESILDYGLQLPLTFETQSPGASARSE